MKHRRDFIKTASAAALALSVAPTTMAGGSRRTGASAPQLAGLHRARFAELLGTPFYLTEASGKVSALTLVAAADVAPRFGNENRNAGVQIENFSLLFRASLDRPLPQGTYEFQHRRIGAFPLFIVPMPGDGRHAYYEAVFNRIS